MMDAQDNIETTHGVPAATPNFSTGEVVSLTFSMLGKNPLLYFTLAFFAGVPGMLIIFFFSVKEAKRVDFFVGALFSAIFMGGISYGVYKGLVGETAGLGEALKRGLSRYWSLVWLSFLLVGVAVLLMGGGIIIRNFAGEALGILALVTASIYLTYISCVWAVTTPACVVERLSARESIRRSGTLTEGHRGAVFGLMFLFALGAVVCGTLKNFFFPFDGLDKTIVEQIIGIPVTAIAQVGISVLYYQLRSAKEGVSVGSLARVFE